MKIEHSLKHRINRTFLLQACAISLAAILGVYLAATVIKHVLVNEALRTEADYFWQQHASNPQFPVPDTRNLTGYLVTDNHKSELPESLRNHDSGLHPSSEWDDFTSVYVTARNNQQLYLVFDGERVNQLATYFGLVPLTVVLTVLYLSVWLTYRASQRAVSPITRLAREVDQLDPLDSDTHAIAVDDLPQDTDREVRVLATALQGLAQRLAAFVERERAFTRDASHELRTPLTVIRMATDVLRERNDLSVQAGIDVDRIRRSSDDMQDLVGAFLLLARETDTHSGDGRTSINNIVTDELDALRLITRNKSLDVELLSDGQLWVREPEKAVSAVVGNLMRNAFTYTDEGKIRIRIKRHQLLIEDSGVGMQAPELEQVFQPFFRADTDRAEGYGIGMTIVKRFTERFRWRLDIQSQAGVGTQVRLDFPNAEFEPDNRTGNDTS